MVVAARAPDGDPEADGTGAGAAPSVVDDVEVDPSVGPDELL